MDLTVIMFFSPSVFLCYVPAPYLLNDWKLIKEMSKARILVVGWQYWFLTGLLVNITVYIEPPQQENKIPNNPHLKVKVKVSHSFIAVGAVGLESHCIMGTAVITSHRRLSDVISRCMSDVISSTSIRRHFETSSRRHIDIMCPLG